MYNSFPPRVKLQNYLLLPLATLSLSIALVACGGGTGDNAEGVINPSATYDDTLDLPGLTARGLSESMVFSVGEPVNAFALVAEGDSLLTNCKLAEGQTLPDGLNLVLSTDKRSCQFTGTPIDYLPQTAYTVIATGKDGSSNAVMSFRVSSDSPYFDEYEPIQAIIGGAFDESISNINPDSGKVIDCELVSGSLPAGLRLNADSINNACLLSGVLDSLKTSATYTISATTDNGEKSQFNLKISVKENTSIIVIDIDNKSLNGDGFNISPDNPEPISLTVGQTVEIILVDGHPLQADILNCQVIEGTTPEGLVVAPKTIGDSADKFPVINAEEFKIIFAENNKREEDSEDEDQKKYTDDYDDDDDDGRDDDDDDDDDGRDDDDDDDGRDDDDDDDDDDGKDDDDDDESKYGSSLDKDNLIAKTLNGVPANNPNTNSQRGACVLSGTPTKATDETTLTVSVGTVDKTGQFTLVITVLPEDPGANTITPDNPEPISLTVGQTVEIVLVDGHPLQADILNCQVIEGATPEGLVVAPKTIGGSADKPAPSHNDSQRGACVLSGTPTKATDETTLTVSVSTVDKTGQFTLVITVLPKDPGANTITPDNPEPIILTVGQTVEIVVVDGHPLQADILNCQVIEGTTPAGLVIAPKTIGDSADQPALIDIDSQRGACVLSGTPTKATDETTLTVSVSTVDKTGQFTLVITVLPEPAPDLNNILGFQKITAYSDVANFIFTNNNKGRINQCALAPGQTLPRGLGLEITADKNSCRITGVATLPRSSSLYSVIATNDVGSDTSSTINLGVDHNPLNEALDTYDLGFSHVGNSFTNWRNQVIVTSDASDALESGLIFDPGQRSCLQTKVRSGRSIRFNWRQNARINMTRRLNDVMIFYIDGNAVNPLAYGGITGWEQRTYYIKSINDNQSEIPVEWCFLKREFGLVNFSFGYLDRVDINIFKTPEPILRLISPTEIAIGWESIPDARYYQVWRSESADFTKANHIGIDLTSSEFTDDSIDESADYYYFVQACDAEKNCSFQSRYAAHRPALAQALDTGFLQFSPSELNTADWKIQTEIDENDVGALASGNINDHQYSCLSARIPAATSGIQFNWRVDTKRSLNDLSFYVDGREIDNISFNKEWTKITHTFSDKAKSKHLRWCYEKVESRSGGIGTGYLDRLNLTISE